MLELEARGADLIELGVPFSDPMADGPANQRALARGLASGASLAAILAMVSELRRESQIPIMLFGYFNPILHYGCERLCADAARAGVDGLLVVDLPPEEAAELARPARAHGLDIIYLLAPTTPIERVRTIARAGSGFLYYVAVTGVTGTRTSLAAGLETRVRALRAVTDLPIGVGFGISTAGAGGRGRRLRRRGRGRQRTVADNRARGRGSRTCGGGGRNGGCDEERDARGARSRARHGRRLSDGGARAGRAGRRGARERRRRKHVGEMPRMPRNRLSQGGRAQSQRLPQVRIPSSPDRRAAPRDYDRSRHLARAVRRARGRRPAGIQRLQALPAASRTGAPRRRAATTRWSPGSARSRAIRRRWR